MRYELAKELKDAGFPQTGRGPTMISPGNLGPTAVAPTLSELIDAVGEDLHSLVRKKRGFEARSMADFNDMIDLGHGETPEEAVARLWLALNQKI